MHIHTHTCTHRYSQPAEEAFALEEARERVEQLSTQNKDLSKQLHIKESALVKAEQSLRRMGELNLQVLYVCVFVCVCMYGCLYV